MPKTLLVPASPSPSGRSHAGVVLPFRGEKEAEKVPAVPSAKLRLREDVPASAFVTAYPPFSCWSESAVDGYRAVLERPSQDVPFCLYVHLPFCVKKCERCYYLKHNEESCERVDDYLDALFVELATYARLPGLEGRELDSVYFGGAMPPALSIPLVRKLVDEIQGSFPLREVREITYECAPLTVTPSRMRELHRLGVTRLSLNAVHLDDELLAKNGYEHTRDDVEQAYAAIRRYDFQVVEVRLQVGMEGESDEAFERSLDYLAELEPDAITLRRSGCRLGEHAERAVFRDDPKMTVLPWAVESSRLERGLAELERYGLTLTGPGEAVDDPDRHRFLFQEAQERGAEVLGIGVSAFSYLRGVHQQNVRRVEDYLRALGQGRLPLGRAYALDATERRVRSLLRELRSGWFRRTDFVEPFAARLPGLIERGWLFLDGDFVVVTREGLARIEQVERSLYLAAHREG